MRVILNFIRDYWRLMRVNLRNEKFDFDQEWDKLTRKAANRQGKS